MSRGPAAGSQQRDLPAQSLVWWGGLAAEHGVLLRQLGSLQCRMDQLQREHARESGALKGELLRLRAQMIIAHTGVCWGLVARPMTTGAAAPLVPGSVARPATWPPDEALAAARAVMCQTGCSGHAHPWREADGQCRLSGEACDSAAVLLVEQEKQRASLRR